jgi:hypothetical protein
MSMGNSFTRLAVAVTALCLALAPSALAAKGGGGGKGGGGKPTSGTGTISLVRLDSTDGMTHFGQRVTFDVWASSTYYPWVTVKCYQGGGLVYQVSNGIFGSSLNEVFTLGPTPSWQGGAADCTAYLENWDSYSKNGNITTITSMAFHVDP